jgi:O-antigen/teichoic acid export membrane protein
VSATPPGDTDHGGALEAVESRTAGNRIIRGGAIRAAGYVAGTGGTALAFALLLRHLSVVDFGRFSTVIALVTVATGLAEAGLTVVGQRLYATADAEGRRRLMRNLVGIRLLLTPVAVVACALFAVVAGYGTTLVVGTLVAGAGAVLAATAGTVAIPLAMELRYGTVTFLEVARQLTIVAGIVLLVALDASLGAFFLVYLAAGVVMLVLAAIAAGREQVSAPAVAWTEWRAILAEAGPLALFTAVNVFYLKLLIVMASLLTTGEELGLFATASRVTEVLVGLPTFMVGVAFPLLAHAGAHDEERLAYAMQRIGEVTLLLAALFTVVLVVGAEPVIRIFAGSGYEEAVPVLRIQALALLGASMTQAWILGVVAVGAQRMLVVVNVLALASVGVLGAALIPPLDAQGASLAAVLGEAILAVAMIVALARARPALTPDLRYVPRVALASGVALCCLLLPAPALVQAGVAAVVLVGVAWCVRAVPAELVGALVRRDPAGT